MKTNQSSASRGFTLVEIIVVMTISALVMGLLAYFFTEASKGFVVINQRLNQSIDFRRFSQELMYNASRANQVYLYKSIRTADWNNSNPLLVELSPTPDATDPTITNHPAGDFVVFVFYEIPKPLNLTYHRIKKLVGYYLDAQDGQIGAIRKFTIDLSVDVTNPNPTTNTTLGDQVTDYYVDAANPANNKTMVEAVIRDNWLTVSATHTKLENYALYVRGLFESEQDATGVGRLFYYRDNFICMMVAGQLYSTKNYGSAGFLQKLTYTDTFNFTITPRS